MHCPTLKQVREKLTFATTLSAVLSLSGAVLNAAVQMGTNEEIGNTLPFIAGSSIAAGQFVSACGQEGKPGCKTYVALVSDVAAVLLFSAAAIVENTGKNTKLANFLGALGGGAAGLGNLMSKWDGKSRVAAAPIPTPTDTALKITIPVSPGFEPDSKRLTSMDTFASTPVTVSPSPRPDSTTAFLSHVEAKDAARQKPKKPSPLSHTPPIHAVSEESLSPY